MAIYEYRCLDCDKAFEIIEPIGKHDADGLHTCPTCGGAHAERCFSSVAIETAKKGYHPAEPC